MKLAKSLERLGTEKAFTVLAEAKKLQPHFIEQFFIEAFKQLSGSIKERESKRYEISNVPQIIQGDAENRNDRQRILKRYERVTFEKKLITLMENDWIYSCGGGVNVLDNPVHVLVQFLFYCTCLDES